jgi:hypothetical protein
MFGELYQYLIFHKKLNLPGIGTLQLERKPAEFDHAARIINPSTYSIVLHHGHVTPSDGFIGWLAASLHSTEHDARARFDEFIHDTKNEISAGHKVEWERVGVLSKGLAGEIRFDSAVKSFTTDQPVAAIKIVRDKAEHIIRVGEKEKTSAEMIELLNPGKEKKSAWWAAALIAALVALLFCVIYFSQKGMQASSVGNQRTISPAKQSGTYQLLQ